MMCREQIHEEHRVHQAMKFVLIDELSSGLGTLDKHRIFLDPILTVLDVEKTCCPIVPQHERTVA